MCRSKFHLHIPSIYRVFVQCGLGTCMIFVVVCAGVKYVLMYTFTDTR